MTISVHTCVIILYGLLGDPTTSVKFLNTQKTGRKTNFLRYVPLFNEWNLKCIKRPQAAHAMSGISGSTLTKVTSLFFSLSFQSTTTCESKTRYRFYIPTCFSVAYNK